jgi:hypothetical protein
MGRVRLWTEDMGARFEKGTFAKIDRYRFKEETRTDFVRAAVEREIDYRAAAKKAARQRRLARAG